MLGTKVLPQSKLFTIYLYPLIPDSVSIPLNSDFKNLMFLKAFNNNSGFEKSNFTIESDVKTLLFPTPSVLKYSNL